MIWFLRGRQAATSPGWNIVCVAFRGRGGSRASGGLYTPAGGGGEQVVRVLSCCESQSACHGVIVRWSRAVVARPRGPPTVGPPARSGRQRKVQQGVSTVRSSQSALSNMYFITHRARYTNPAL